MRFRFLRRAFTHDKPLLVPEVWPEPVPLEDLEGADQADPPFRHCAHCGGIFYPHSRDDHSTHGCQEEQLYYRTFGLASPF